MDSDNDLLFQKRRMAGLLYMGGSNGSYVRKRYPWSYKFTMTNDEQYLAFLLDTIDSALKELKRALERMEIINPYEGIDLEGMARERGICYVCYREPASIEYDGICERCFSLELDGLLRKEGKNV